MPKRVPAVCESDQVMKGGVNEPVKFEQQTRPGLLVVCAQIRLVLDA